MTPEPHLRVLKGTTILRGPDTTHINVIGMHNQRAIEIGSTLDVWI